MSAGRRWSEVAAGVFRIAVADVNCYLLQTTDGLTLYDAGLPGSRGALTEVLAHLGATVSDIDALVLTHGHFDHVGMGRMLQSRGVDAHVHPRDVHLARHPYSYRPEEARVAYLLSHPRGIPPITRMALRGALGVRGIDVAGRVSHGHPVDAPGMPIALWTPGHTGGHCAFFSEETGVLISGDALVTLDPYTGERGPQIVARAATADTSEALASLDVLDESEASLVLPGHGEPSRDGVRADTAAARRRGAH